MYIPKDLKKEVKRVIAILKDKDAGHVYMKDKDAGHVYMNYPIKPARTPVHVLKDVLALIHDCKQSS